MGDYLNFINQYGNRFVSDLQYEDYEKLRTSLKAKIEEILSFRGVSFAELDKLVLYAMCQFLSKHTTSEVLNGNFDDELETIIKKVYDSVESRKPAEEQKPFPEKNEAVDYLYKDFKNKKYIFKEDFNIGRYSKNVRDDLVYEGYKDEDILAGNADQRVIALMAGGYFDLRLSEEFKDMREAVTKLVVPYFNYMKKQSLKYNSRNSLEYNYFDNRNILVNVIFCLSIEFLRRGVNAKQLTSNSPEASVIQDYIQRDLIRVNSTRPKQETEWEKWKKVPREVKEERIEHAKKTAIVLAILFGLMALENLIYKSIHEKEEEPKHNRSKFNIEDTAFDIDRVSNNIQRLRYNPSDNTVVLPEAQPQVLSAEQAPIDPTIVENFEYELEGDKSVGL